MMPQLAILPVYHPPNRTIFNLDNFTLVPHPNLRRLMQKSPKKFG